LKGIILDWPGTLASIPTDWLLCTGNFGTPNLLGKYLLSVGASEDPGTTGGSATHTHTSPAHTHTQDTHYHEGLTNTVASTWGANTGGVGVSAGTHDHNYTSSSTVATNQNTSITTDTASNDPTYYKVAPIIDSSTTGVKYPTDSLVFWPKSTLPIFWYTCDGSNDTVDLRGKFLKCVDSGENPGATGGSATHTHTPNTHTHTQDGHVHTGTTGSPGTTGCYWGSGYAAGASHTHDLTIASTVAVNQNANVTLDTINGEPTFKKLSVIQNKGVANRPKYSIVKWTGTIANIPLGYVLCDGSSETIDLREYFIKVATTTAEIGDTGGSSVHNHTASSHNHTQNSHIHSVTSSGASAQIQIGSGDRSVIGNHDHSFDSSSVTATNQATTITIDNCSSQANYPPFYKVAYIMQDKDLDIGTYAFLV
jgi:hypothetical protein